MKRKRAKHVKKAMRLVWASLDSHLPWASASRKEFKKEGDGTRKFHRTTVKEYVRLLKILSKLY